MIKRNIVAVGLGFVVIVVIAFSQSQAAQPRVGSTGSTAVAIEAQRSHGVTEPGFGQTRAPRDTARFDLQPSEGFAGTGSDLGSLPLIIILIVIAMMVFNSQAKGIVSSIVSLLARVFKAGEDLFKTWLKHFVALLRTPPADDDSAADKSSPNPHQSLKGILCLCGGGAAATADFYVLSKSLAVVWPWTGSAQLLAFTLILLTALVGFAIHSLKSRIARRLLIVVALSLIAGQGLLSFLRTVEIERIREIERQHSALVIKRTGVSQGQLVFGGGASKSAAAEATEPQPVKKQLEEGPGAITGKALIAGMIAALIAFGEMVGFYLGFYLAGAAITWVVAAPLLAVCALGCGAFYVVRHVVEALGFLLTGLVDAMADAGKFIGHAASRLRPEALLQSYYELRRRTLSRRSDLRALQAELKTKHQIETLRTATQLSELEIELAHSSSLNAECRQGVEDWLASILEGLKKTQPEISETVSTEIIALCQGQARETFKSAAQRLVSSSTAPFEKIGSAIDRAAPYKQTHSENGNKRQEERR